MKFARAPRRSIGRRMRQIRDDASRSAPVWLSGPLDPVVDTLDLHLFDHGLFRLVYSNTHQLTTRVWRSSQPTPGRLRALAAQGVKTVVNLRGERNCGGYRLEVEACEKLGLKLESFIVRSRAAPEAGTVAAAKALFERVEYPMVMHCKSGADRVGLMSALYLIFGENVPVEQAKEQLHWRYGHFRSADTGILDAFFDRYLAFNRTCPMPFLDWVTNVYDAEELKRTFASNTWGNVLVNTVLRRE